MTRATDFGQLNQFNGQSQIPLFAVTSTDAAYSESLPLIDSGTPSNSRIVKKGADGHCGSSFLDSSKLPNAVHSWLDARLAGGLHSSHSSGTPEHRVSAAGHLSQMDRLDPG
ncbi:MAG: hypothetical protein H7222_08460 [Methylotenera sp.]|nr:hypothetical protein [Oligoflexia bacterium]